jgi:hypothetical protein
MGAFGEEYLTRESFSLKKWWNGDVVHLIQKLFDRKSEVE